MNEQAKKASDFFGNGLVTENLFNSRCMGMVVSAAQILDDLGY